ncbi:hypothetical protein ACUNV4_29110 [Granulosicoccus sp. 3-233]|uniref:hypothetical protein n=1 Tax=Granulosicoccus sp. 3-233 TaxID=3417969 RepID=UPI003D32C79A
MLNIIWTLVGVFFIMSMLRWSSPLIFLAPNIIIATLFTDFSGGNGDLVGMIMFGWFFTLLLVTLYFRKRRIRIDRYYASGIDNARFDKKGRRYFYLATVVLMVIIVFWISQAGVDSFESQKRSRGGGLWLNALNYALKIYTLHAVIVFSFSKITRSNPHVVLAMLSLLVIMVIGFMSSSRGVFVVPILTILIFRFMRVKDLKGKLFLAGRSIVVLVVLVQLMSVISEVRKGKGEQSGISLIIEQLNNNEAGYGLSPAKDARIYDYGERDTIPSLRTVIFGGFYGYIPRVFWSNKPNFVSSGPLVGAFVFREQYFITELGAGIPASFPSEVALGFGSEWFFPSFILVMIMMILVGEFSVRYPYIITSSFSFYAGLPAHGLPKSQLELIMSIVIMALLLRLTGFKVMFR